MDNQKIDDTSMVTFSIYTYPFSSVAEAEGVTFFPDETDLRSRYEMRHRAFRRISPIPTCRRLATVSVTSKR